ncbi:MAG: hypothetical protein PW791_09340 [Neorhizobium sp.]|nr:hypothetical protein [Neorhizobium sp.]
MPNTAFDRGFDKWWDNNGKGIGFAERRRLREVFVAGCEFSAKEKEYRFVCGKWSVEVKAPTRELARREAARVLDVRAAKAGKERPPGGWPLRRERSAP